MLNDYCLLIFSCWGGALELKKPPEWIFTILLVHIYLAVTGQIPLDNDLCLLFTFYCFLFPVYCLLLTNYYWIFFVLKCLLLAVYSLLLQFIDFYSSASCCLFIIFCWLFTVYKLCVYCFLFTINYNIRDILNELAKRFLAYWLSYI